MDGQRFDELTKALVTGSSRRRVLKGLVGGVLGGALGAVGLREAAAICPHPLVDCPRIGSGNCVNLKTDPANCGRCGRVCGEGQVCYAARCMTSCPRGFEACGGTCYRECSGDQELNPETCACEAISTDMCSNPFNPETCQFDVACLGCQVGDTCISIFDPPGGRVCTTSVEGGTICGIPTTGGCDQLCATSADCAEGQRCGASCCDGGTGMICYQVELV